MRTSLTPFLFLCVFLHRPSAVCAQAVDCDTVTVVAQASAQHLTCANPVGTLIGAQHPTAQSYHWTGPGGFSSNERIATAYLKGIYVLTVTGPYGCTAQASTQLKDNCTFYPLDPPECPSAYDPPAENCASVCVRPFIPLYYPFSNYGAQFDPTPPWPCGVPHNDQWFAFVAGATAGTIMMETSNCANGDGLQLALFEDCSSAPLFCEGGVGGGGGQPVIMSVSGLELGKVYYLMVDGWQGDMCDYQFVIDPKLCSGSGGYDPPNPKFSGPSKVCPNAMAQYTLNPAPFATAYLWTAPPGALINGEPGPLLIYGQDGQSVSITFGDQPGAVAVRAINYFRPPSAPYLIPVQMQPIPPTVLPKKVVCFEELPYVWEEIPFTTLTAPGTYNLTSDPYSSYLGCDSVVKQQIVVLPPKMTNLGLKTVCKNDCFTINGNNYCQPGVYTEVLTSYNGCDSLVSFSLNVLDPVAEISGAGALTCTIPSLTLNAAPGSGNKRWLNANGQVIGLGNTLTVTLPGIYILTSTQTASGKSCTVADTVVILHDFVPPVVSASASGVLACAPSTVTLTGDVLPSGTSLLWSGPGGFSSTKTQPVVSLPGVYQLVAIGPNGCTATATVTVETVQTPPTVTASGGTLTCTVPNTTLAASSPDPGVSFQWSGPGGFVSQSADPLVGIPGDYTLTATGANGCTATATATVTADQTPPAVTASGDTVTCTVPNTALAADSPDPGVIFQWSGPGGFISMVAHPLVGIPGDYTLTVTGINGCTATAVATVLADQEPPGLTATGDTLDCWQASVVLTASSPATDVGFQWTGPDGFTADLATPVVHLPGEYTVMATGANGCTSTALVQVVPDLAPPVVSASGGTITCKIPSAITLEAVSNPPAVAYAWAGPGGFSSTLPAPVVTVIGMYTVTVTAANGCTASAEAQFTLDQTAPDIGASGDTLTCKDPKIALDGSSNTPGAVFQWSGPGGFLSMQENPQVTAPGMYTLTVTNPANGCTSAMMVAVPADLTLPGVDVFQWPPVCGDSLLFLDASSPQPGATFSWTGPGGFLAQTEDIVVAIPGWYNVEATGPNGCQSKIAVLAVAAPQPPVITYTTDTISCAHPTATIAVSASIPGVTYAWSGPGDPLPQIPAPVVNTSGAYSVTVTAPNGCTASADIFVSADLSGPDLQVSGGGVITCQQPVVVLGAASSTPGAVIYWLGGDWPAPLDTVLVTVAGIYTAIATAPNGCTNSQSVLVVDSCTVSTPEPSLPVYQGIVVYPNATAGALVVQSLDGTAIEALRLYRPDGVLLREEKPAPGQFMVPWDLSDLPAGAYTLTAMVRGRWWSRVVLRQ